MCIDALKVENVMTYNATKITNTFGNYFANVGQIFANKINKSKTNVDSYLEKIRMDSTSIFLDPVTCNEVDRMISQLPNKKSSGYDNISNILLKTIKTEITRPLVTIFNLSMSTGIFPERMKNALVVPLHKGLSKDELINYRPISLLITISKILEKVMYTRVYNFLAKTQQIYESQYGFRARHSCDHAIGELLSEITKSMELSKETVCTLLDLSKAFDMLEHSVIFKKMERYGLHGPCLDWFKSYLNGRTLRVKCNTGNGVCTSNEYIVKYGTPQGSCLGPLIFLIFCNDLQLHLLYLEAIQFADDTTLYMSHKHAGYIRFCFETDLAIIQDWFNANKLTLNVSKSVIMRFNNKNRKHQDNMDIKIGGIILPVVRQTKFLGVYLDDRLNWNVHIKGLQLKLKSRLYLLKKGKHLLSVHAKKDNVLCPNTQ